MAAAKESLQVSAYSRRLKESVKSILDNYAEILKAAKVIFNLSTAWAGYSSQFVL